MKGKKTGGRTKGTLNKQTCLNQTIGHNLQKDGIIPLLQYVMFGGDIPPQLRQGQLVSLLSAVEGKDALSFVEKLMQYVVPKMQSTSIDLTATNANKTIEDTLGKLAEES